MYRISSLHSINKISEITFSGSYPDLDKYREVGFHTKQNSKTTHFPVPKGVTSLYLRFLVERQSLLVFRRRLNP